MKKSEKIVWNNVTQFEKPEQSPGFLLWQTSTLWRRQIEQALETIHLTHTQFVLLANIAWLTHDNKNVSQVDLAKQCKTDINVTSQVLRTLEKRNFIERMVLKSNLRTKSLVVTESGKQLVAQAIPLVESIDAQFFKQLDTLEQKNLVKLLTKLTF